MLDHQITDLDAYLPRAFGKRETRIAWAAGLFEGEGCIANGTSRHSVHLQLVMTDEDVVRRFHRIVGVGAVALREPPSLVGRGCKTQWSWYVYSVEDVRRTLVEFLPYFGTRRRERAEQAFSTLSGNRGARALRTTCLRGHPYDENNTRYHADGSRYCRECDLQRQRARYHAKKVAT
jgi:hypothetical protein